jgi:hypothetical protein
MTTTEPTATRRRWFLSCGHYVRLLPPLFTLTLRQTQGRSRSNIGDVRRARRHPRLNSRRRHRRRLAAQCLERWRWR